MPKKSSTSQGVTEGLSCPVPLTEYKQVLLAHGGGGKLSKDLTEQVFFPQFKNSFLAPLHDGAAVFIDGAHLAFSTDSYVVDPLFFPGGDIGSLAINGTINDLAMCGAQAQYLSIAFIVEEGFPMDDLRRVVASASTAARNSLVQLVTGDTKVVDRGKCDKMFINTSGIGVIAPGVHINPKRARIGDVVLISGRIAEHGIAVMSVREGFETKLQSDTAPLCGLVEIMLEVTNDIHVLRDPTRGGVATSLNEIAMAAHIGVEIDEQAIPVNEEAKDACEILGFDPLYVANEGKLIAFVPAVHAEPMIEAMRAHPLGRNAAIIGSVTDTHRGLVVMKTTVGGTRVVDLLSGEQLPRIC
ncbi:MAG: hydrogenase expression/formation protein HypE [Bacteroidota bacterium]